MIFWIGDAMQVDLDALLLSPLKCSTQSYCHLGSAAFRHIVTLEVQHSDRHGD